MKPTTRIDDPFADLFEQAEDHMLLEQTIYDEVEDYDVDDLIDLPASDNDF